MDQDFAFTVTVEDRGDRSSVQAMGELDLAAEHAGHAALGADASEAEAMTIVNMSSAVHRVAELTGVLEMLEPVRSER